MMTGVKKVETRLMPRMSKTALVCIHCNARISPGQVYHQEEGLREHLHSLIARRFCSGCYAKYGEQILLKGNSE